MLRQRFVCLSEDIGDTFYDVIVHQRIPEIVVRELNELQIILSASVGFHDLACKEDQSVENLIRFFLPSICLYIPFLHFYYIGASISLSLKSLNWSEIGHV